MDNCIFCRIVKGEIPSLRVYEDESCIATLDIGPAERGHVLIIPKEHYADVTECTDEALLGKLMKTAAGIGARQMERLGADGFNIVQNNKEAAGQTVRHLHIHVIPRYENHPVIVAWDPKDPGQEELRKVYDILKD